MLASRTRALLRLSLLACGLAWLGCGTPGASPASPSGADAAPESGPDATEAGHACTELAAQFELALAAEAALEGRAGGAVAAVISPTCGLWAGDVGEAEPGAQLSRGRLLRVGSVTKTFTAAAVLALVADGVLSLDAALQVYVSGYPGGEEITIRQLLNHTSGTFDIIEDEGFMKAARTDPDREFTAQELIAVAAAGEPVFAPGTSWSYSNTNYILLGRIIETATGQPAVEVLRERALAAAGIERAFLEGAEAVPEAIAPGYGDDDRDLTRVVHPSLRWTAGALVTDVTELARWAHALYRGDVLPAAQYATMRAGVATGGGSMYGLGVYILEIPGVGRVYGHGGNVPGYRAIMLYAEEFDLTAVAIVNSDRAAAQPIARALLAVAAARAE